MQKQRLKQLTDRPIGIWKQFKTGLKKRAEAKLFDGNDSLFRRLIADAKVYAEYGCGASTIWVANNTDCTILSVESSEQWVDLVRTNCGARDRLFLHFADIGRIVKRGRPANYDRFENFDGYTEWVWRQPYSPDLVLIDGRFRVCCFLISLFHAKEGTKILFDDYTHREHYHFVEKFLQPLETCGRQALFIVPSKAAMDLDQIKAFAHQFQFVFE